MLFHPVLVSGSNKKQFDSGSGVALPIASLPKVACNPKLA